MASMKYDQPMLGCKTRFSLWQMKMRAVLAQSQDLDEALDYLGKKKDEWCGRAHEQNHHLEGSLYIVQRTYEQAFLGRGHQHYMLLDQQVPFYSTQQEKSH